MAHKNVIVVMVVAVCNLAATAVGQEVPAIEGLPSRTWKKLPPRTWTRVDGKSANGVLIWVEGNKVILLIKEKEYTFEIKEFVPSDQKYIADAAKFKFDNFKGFEQVTVTSITSEEIALRHAAGVARIPIHELGEKWGKHFGIDTLEKLQAKGVSVDQNSWKYGNLDWGSTSDAVTKLLAEKGFKITDDALFNVGKPRFHRKSPSGRFTRTSIEYSDGEVMGKDAVIVCDFANDRLHRVKIYMTLIAAFSAKVQQVLDQKYNPNPGEFPKNSWGPQRSLFGGPNDQNRTRISYSRVTEPTPIAVIRYDYESSIAKLVDEGFKKEEKAELKKKADASDL